LIAGETAGDAAGRVRRRPRLVGCSISTSGPREHRVAREMEQCAVKNQKTLNLQQPGQNRLIPISDRHVVCRPAIVAVDY
jgi:hypothetical protein